MDNKELAINSASYNASTKHYLKALLDQGLITKEEYEKIDKSLYQAYNMDEVEKYKDKKRQTKWYFATKSTTSAKDRIHSE